MDPLEALWHALAHLDIDALLGLDLSRLDGLPDVVAPLGLDLGCLDVLQLLGALGHALAPLLVSGLDAPR